MPTEFRAPASAAFAIGDAAANTVAPGQVRVCNTGSDATFDVLLLAGPGTVAGADYAIAAGACRVVAEDLASFEDFTLLTVTQDPATSLQSVTCSSLDGPCGFANGDVVIVNAFIGVLLTFSNAAPPPPPPPQPEVEQVGSQGCGSGYWKQSHHLDSWEGHAPTDGFNATFGVGTEWFPDSFTLLDALKKGGGGKFALGRAAVAALLNASSADVAYPLLSDEIISAVQGVYPGGNVGALASELDGHNNLGCPLR